MTDYGKQRYQKIPEGGPSSIVYKDTNLDRIVSIHCVAPISDYDIVRSRLAALQSVRSPYVALIYDIVKIRNQVGVVEEELKERIKVSEADRLHRLYEFCAGLAALHDNNLAHGALDGPSFRMGPLGKGRLCKLAFGSTPLNNPSIDRDAFAAQLEAMGADKVRDDTFKTLRRQLTATAQFTAHAFRDRLAALLLRDKHRALVYWRGTSVELGEGRRSARFVHSNPDIASIKIEYDGTRFFVAEVAGEVHINNISPSTGADLPSSCVIVLGNSHRPWHQRYSITFDQSHPEVA